MRTLLVALVVTALALGSSVALTGQMSGKTDPALNKLAKEWETAFNAKDFAKVASLYAEDAAVMPPNHPMVRGRANIETFFKKEFGQANARITLNPSESTLSDTVAYEIGAYTLSMTPQGSQPITDKGNYIVILKKAGDGQWRLTYDCFNTDLPSPPPPKT